MTVTGVTGMLGGPVLVRLGKTRLREWWLVAFFLHLALGAAFWRKVAWHEPKPPSPPVSEIPLEIAEAPSAPAPPEPEPAHPASPIHPARAAANAAGEARAALPQPAPSTPPPVQPTPQNRIVALAEQRVTDARVGFRLLLQSEPLRAHSLGPKVAGLLEATPVLHDFLAAARLHPLRDLDQLLISGSGLPNSDAGTAILRYNVPRYRVRSALWSLAAGPEPTEEQAVVLAARQIVVLTPEAARPDAEQLPAGFGLPEATEAAIELYLAKPARLLAAWHVDVPKSLRWAKFNLVLAPDGSATLSLRAQDATPAQAKANAQLLSAQLTQVLPGLEIVLSAAGAVISGQTSLSEEELAALLDLARRMQADEAIAL